MDTETKPRPHILTFIERIEANIERRRLALASDYASHQILVDRVVSTQLADVPGMKTFLERTRAIKEGYALQDVQDATSHTVIKRIDVHKRYTERRKHGKDIPGKDQSDKPPGYLYE
jgi:hypothetical protein